MGQSQHNGSLLQVGKVTVWPDMAFTLDLWESIRSHDARHWFFPSLEERRPSLACRPVQLGCSPNQSSPAPVLTAPTDPKWRTRRRSTPPFSKGPRCMVLLFVWSHSFGWPLGLAGAICDCQSSVHQGSACGKGRKRAPKETPTWATWVSQRQNTQHGPSRMYGCKQLCSNYGCSSSCLLFSTSSELFLS